MAGLTLTLERGDSFVVEIPLEDEAGHDVVERVRVTCVETASGRVSLAIEAPRDWPIERLKAAVVAAK